MCFIEFPSVVLGVRSSRDCFRCCGVPVLINGCVRREMCGLWKSDSMLISCVEICNSLLQVLLFSKIWVAFLW